MQPKRAIRRQNQPDRAAAQLGNDVNRVMEAAISKAGLSFSWETFSVPEWTD